MKHTKSMVYKESDASNELFLYAVNEGRLYRSMILPIIENLKKKTIKGIYDPEKAVDLYYNAASEAAKMYNKEFSTPGYNPFSVTDRYTVAVEIERYYKEQIEFDIKEGDNA